MNYWTLFTTFAKIGAFTIGGGLAMIPLIQKEVVEKHGWIDEEEFLDIIAVAETAPGLIAVNVSIFIGYKLYGVKGSIVATLGSIVPPFFIILLIAMFFTNFQDNPYVQKIFMGIRPAVVALIAVPMVQLAIQSRLRWWEWGVSAAALALIAFVHLSPVWILLTLAALSVCRMMIQDRKIRKGE